ncbi:MAG: hypothetical protein JXE06_05725 [Coriobacteriia bacterium]|nr:hypothetical protein [Coriobacteriia bacterium]MBN2823435.1 hypothetical protein [Coriobacteriia bacterium]
MMYRRVVMMSLALALVLSALAGCAATDDETVDPLPNEGEVGAQILDGEMLVAERCTGCHSLDPVDDASLDAVGWEAEVERMIEKGARLDDDEKAAVIEYLSTR